MNKKQTKRLQSVYLLNYINNAKTPLLSSSISSDDDIPEVISDCSSTSDDTVTNIDHDEFVKSFTIAFDLLFAQISEIDQNRFMQKFTVKKIAENFTFSNTDNALILMLSSDGCYDADNGRMYGMGSIINIETFIFRTVHNPHNIMTAEIPVNIAELDAKHFNEFNTIRNLFIRTRFSVLSVLTDDELNNINFDYRWMVANETLHLTNQIALLIDGKIYNNTPDNIELPGSIIGVSDLMGETPSLVTAVTQHVGIAIISQDDFQVIMNNKYFNDAINEISFEHTVLMENERRITDATEHDFVLSLHSSNDYDCDSHEKGCILYTDTLEKTIDANDKFHINGYLLDTQIGAGSYSKIFKTDKHVLKLIERKLSRQCIEREIAALHALQHRNIIQLHECIDSPESTIFIFVLELCDHGSLFDVCLPIHECQLVCLQMLDAIQYIHSSGYLHNDIKPSNMLRTKSNTYKLCDFGSCTKIDDTGIKFATPSFQAPETFIDSTCAASDIWAFSVSIYNIVYGKLPFNNQHDRSLYECIQFSPLVFPKGEISENNLMVQDFLSSGLQKVVRERATISDLKKHQFLMRKKRSLQSHELC